jgi:hypothetical protein
MIKKHDSHSRTFENEILEQFGHHFVPMMQIRRAYGKMYDPLSKDLLLDLYEARRIRLIKEAESMGAMAIAEAVRSSEYDLEEIILEDSEK